MSKAKAKRVYGAPATTGVDWSQTYPVCITDKSALPRYSPGDTVHVDPRLPILPGKWVLVVRKNEEAGEAPPVSVIARLVRYEEGHVILEQLDPPVEYRLEGRDILTIHRIVGSSEGDTV